MKVSKSEPGEFNVDHSPVATPLALMLPQVSLMSAYFANNLIILYDLNYSRKVISRTLQSVAELAVVVCMLKH